MNKADLIAQFSVKSQTVNILGTDIVLKDMSGADRDGYFTRIAKADKIETEIDGKMQKFPDTSGIKAYLISRLVLDNNKPAFTEKQAGELTVEFTDAVFDEIVKLNKLSDVEVDESEKN